METGDRNVQTANKHRLGHGEAPGEMATLRSHSKDHPLASIRPTLYRGRLRWEICGQSPSHVPVRKWWVSARANTHNGDRRSWLCVLNQLPGHRLPFVGRHHVVVSDGGSGCRNTDHLPDPALRTAFTSPSCRADWQTSHTSPSLSGAECRDASRLIARFASRMLINDTEPQGSLFVGRRSQGGPHDRQALLTPAGFFFTPSSEYCQGVFASATPTANTTLLERVLY
jgi:hypothetical protein